MGFPRVRWSSLESVLKGFELFRTSWIVVDLPNWTRPVLAFARLRPFGWAAALSPLTGFEGGWLAVVSGCWDPRLNPSGGVCWIYGACTRARLSTTHSLFTLVYSRVLLAAGAVCPGFADRQMARGDIGNVTMAYQQAHLMLPNCQSKVTQCWILGRRSALPRELTESVAA